MVDPVGQRIPVGDVAQGQGIITAEIQHCVAGPETGMDGKYVAGEQYAVGVPRLHIVVLAVDLVVAVVSAKFLAVMVLTLHAAVGGLQWVAEKADAADLDSRRRREVAAQGRSVCHGPGTGAGWVWPRPGPTNSGGITWGMWAAPIRSTVDSVRWSIVWPSAACTTSASSAIGQGETGDRHGLR